MALYITTKNNEKKINNWKFHVLNSLKHSEQVECSNLINNCTSHKSKSLLPSHRKINCNNILYYNATFRNRRNVMINDNVLHEEWIANEWLTFHFHEHLKTDRRGNRRGIISAMRRQNLIIRFIRWTQKNRSTFKIQKRHTPNNA